MGAGWITVAEAVRTGSPLGYGGAGWGENGMFEKSMAGTSRMGVDATASGLPVWGGVAFSHGPITGCVRRGPGSERTSVCRGSPGGRGGSLAGSRILSLQGREPVSRLGVRSVCGQRREGERVRKRG